MTKFSSLAQILAHDYNAVIDVRSPAEFAEDHVPGAINLPVLDNDERAEVGTMYKQVSPFRARKIGAALVFRNAARHVEETLADHEGGWRPLVYCWRGGQRSGSFAWMLREIGWRADVIEGGYRTFRRLVVRVLYDEPLPHSLVKLAGYTGTAKTELLHRLDGLGIQVLDLEALARHRGSLLGAWDAAQPSQKAFEGALAAALARLDPSRPVVVEAESSKIGRVTLPPSLWRAMTEAQTVEVSAPLEARAEYLSHAYADILADGPQLKEKLSPLLRVRGRALLEKWNALIDAGDKGALCAALAEDHYDPSYRRSAKAHGNTPVAEIALRELSDVVLDDGAERIAEAVQRIATSPDPSFSRPTTAAS